MFFFKLMKSAHKFDNATPFLKTVGALIPHAFVKIK